MLLKGTSVSFQRAHERLCSSYTLQGRCQSFRSHLLYVRPCLPSVELWYRLGERGVRELHQPKIFQRVSSCFAQ